MAEYTKEQLANRWMPWMMEADRQWRIARPRFVRFLKQRNVYRQTLAMAAERAHRTAEQLMKAGLDPVTAFSEAKTRDLILPSEIETPMLEADLAPFGQPKPANRSQQK